LTLASPRCLQRWASFNEKCQVDIHISSTNHHETALIAERVAALRGGRYRRGIRQWTAVLLFAVLADCGGSRQIQEAAEATSDGWNEALSECRNTYFDQITQAVARAACVNKATDLLRPALPFGDLLDQEIALRKSLAAQVQAGTLSLIERNRQFTKFHSRMLAEEQSRLVANPAANTTSAAATQWRLSNPEGCTSLGGNTQNCY
jgi:hypothetical protein